MGKQSLVTSSKVVPHVSALAPKPSDIQNLGFDTICLLPGKWSGRKGVDSSGECALD